MRWIDGFWMSWGMFLAIPCPCKRWNEEARGQMLCCLPLVGGVAGGLWALSAWLLGILNAPGPLKAFVLAVLPWLATGFLHLDGFMDVCDAVLSRRDLATRQKILKDSHCGAFAVISMVLLAGCQWSVFLSLDDYRLLSLGLVPVATRGCAAMAVQLLRPMGTSQYAAMARAKKGNLAFLAAVTAAACVVPLGLYGRAGAAPLGAGIGYWLAALGARRNLDGMSGDVSGFALTLGELAGAALLLIK